MNSVLILAIAAIGLAACTTVACTAIDSDILDVTPLRYLVLTFLIRHRILSGRDLRGMLSDNGVNSSGPQFYQLMSRLEASGYVRGWYAQKEIEHQVVNERRYEATEAGTSAWKKTGDFYSGHAAGTTVNIGPNGPQAKKASPRAGRTRRGAIVIKA